MNILVIGATSAIAQAFCRLYAPGGANFWLLARNGEKLEALGADLKVRGAASVAVFPLDALDLASHAALMAQVAPFPSVLDLALIAHGTLGNQADCERDPNAMLHEITTNAISVLYLLTQLAPRFEMQESGTIAVIGSVAGDRGRASNYVYGSAKGMVAIFLQGLRHRLWKKNVQVLTIKPGFVDTPMTRNFTKGALWASPEKVALDIARAVEKKAAVIYTPGFWRFIMLIIVHIPERLFKRLKL